MSVLSKIISVLTLAILVSLPVRANSSIGVLDFELNDVTSNPGVAEEVERTASLKRLLEEHLSGKGYHIDATDPAAQAAATKGFGYLWDHSDEAAELGKNSGSEFVVVGRLHKPSFLFVYLMAHLIDTKTGNVVGDFIVEVKGQQQNFTAKGIENLARQIDTRLKTVSGS
ncbi:MULTISPECIES: DUF2380 domain-containing protein [unclassified Methylocaldum]|jgi:hypothetical protein|uniref:DUF2380 domain-containing protein n=1 Tax=unclassified Methylocaldum TaxID=2622260 RepID=UPI00098BBA5E|nr:MULTISPECIES: DUF2380 domain-containing protein [unclassified Methylocaldum]MBP1148293.1 hypothetical protein [Methylocaldum sp. RMAD-M]